jgi:hypothetical protein
VPFADAAIPVTTSVGVATLHAGIAGASELLADADAALYRAKAEGRDRVVVAPAPPGDFAQVPGLVAALAPPYGIIAAVPGAAAAVIA